MVIKWVILSLAISAAMLLVTSLMLRGASDKYDDDVYDVDRWE